MSQLNQNQREKLFRKIEEMKNDLESNSRIIQNNSDLELIERFEIENILLQKSIELAKSFLFSNEIN